MSAGPGEIKGSRMGVQQEEKVSIERRHLDVAKVTIAEDRVTAPWE